jgi:hypothetical protein
MDEGIEYQRMTYRLPSQASSAATGKDWNTVTTSDLNCSEYLLFIPWDCDPYRDHLVDARICAVE